MQFHTAFLASSENYIPNFLRLFTHNVSRRIFLSAPSICHTHTSQSSVYLPVVNTPFSGTTADRNPHFHATMARNEHSSIEKRRLSDYCASCLQNYEVKSTTISLAAPRRSMSRQIQQGSRTPNVRSDISGGSIILSSTSIVVF